MRIEEPHLTKIKSIIEKEWDSDNAVYSLKIYMLDHIDYFSKLLSRLDVGWLAKEIYLQHKNNTKNRTNI